jgi:hypothetical protein
MRDFKIACYTCTGRQHSIPVVINLGYAKTFWGRGCAKTSYGVCKIKKSILLCDKHLKIMARFCFGKNTFVSLLIFI